VNRWYDKHEELAGYIESFKVMDKEKRSELLNGIMSLIKQYDTNLLDNFEREFPMGTYCHRWYDKDPHTWLVINGLKYAKPNLLEAVTEYLRKNIMDTECDLGSEVLSVASNK
jgi:hypothetical protein